MDKDYHSVQRQNFLLSLLKKITQEYKALLDFTKNTKPLKIVEIIELSNIPGETSFAIQLSNKNCIVPLKASAIIQNGYNLNDFNTFHADLIREAGKGRLIEFLKFSETKPLYKITAKKHDKSLQQYIYTIKTKDEIMFARTADELSEDKNLLLNMDIKDIYDIGYTKGCESILKEKTDLLLAKKSDERNMRSDKK